MWRCRAPCRWRRGPARGRPGPGRPAWRRWRPEASLSRTPVRSTPRPETFRGPWPRPLRRWTASDSTLACPRGERLGQRVVRVSSRARASTSPTGADSTAARWRWRRSCRGAGPARGGRIVAEGPQSSDEGLERLVLRPQGRRPARRGSLLGGEAEHGNTLGVAGVRIGHAPARRAYRGPRRSSCPPVRDRGSSAAWRAVATWAARSPSPARPATAVGRPFRGRAASHPPPRARSRRACSPGPRGSAGCGRGRRGADRQRRRVFAVDAQDVSASSGPGEGVPHRRADAERPGSASSSASSRRSTVGAGTGADNAASSRGAADATGVGTGAAVAVARCLVPVQPAGGGLTRENAGRDVEHVEVA